MSTVREAHNPAVTFTACQSRGPASHWKWINHLMHVAELIRYGNIAEGDKDTSHRTKQTAVCHRRKPIHKTAQRPPVPETGNGFFCPFVKLVWHVHTAVLQRQIYCSGECHSGGLIAFQWRGVGMRKKCNTDDLLQLFRSKSSDFWYVSCSL